MKNKRTEKRLRSVVTYGLTLIAFFFAFGGVMLWGVADLGGNQTASSLPSSPSALFGPSDIRRLLIVMTDGGAVCGINLIVTDPGGGAVTVTAIPPETTVMDGTGQPKLRDLYAAKGIDAVRTDLAATLRCALDYYAVISYDNVGALIAGFENGLICQIPEPVNIAETQLRLVAGKAMLSSEQAVSLLRYQGWSGGIKEAALFRAQMTADLINQYLVSCRSGKGQSDFSRIIDLVSSNIYIADYLSAAPGLDFLAKQNAGQLCTAAMLAGDYVGNGSAVHFEVPD